MKINNTLLNYYGPNDTNIKIGALTADASQGLKSLKKDLRQTNLELERLVRINDKFKGGKVIQKSFEGITRSGERLALTFKKTEKGWERTSRTLSDNTDQTKQNTKALWDQIAARKVFIKQQKKEQDEREKFLEQAKRNFNRGRQRVEERGRQKRLKNLNDLLAAQRVYNKAIEAERQARIRADEALIKARKRIVKFQQEQQNLANAQGVRSNLLSNVNIRPEATASQVNALQQALTTATAFVEKGKITVQRFNEINAAVKKGGKAFKALTADEARAEAALRRFHAAANVASNGVKEASRRISVSWEGMVRLLEVQLLHIIIGRTVNALRDAVEQASEFEKRIGEIQTISQQANVSTQQWSNELRGLSDAFGLDILDIAEGGYQALSNQITQGAETTDFLMKALEFSKATVSSTEDAVNLLTASLNSFGDSEEEAERHAAILFKTVELGRVRVNEMANEFGTTGALANQMGVDLEELAAAITTLTIQGIKYNNAQTLINNVLLKLLKPTEEMQNLIQEWGFASGSAAIQGLGFVGVLRKLEQELARKGPERLGELAGRLRAIRGQIGLVNRSAFERYNKNLEELRGSTESYNQAIDIVLNNLGTRFDIEMNKAANVLKVDFGQAVLESTVNLSESLGGLDHILREILKTFEDLGNVVKPVTKLLSEFTGEVELSEKTTGRLVVTTLKLAAAYKIVTALQGKFGAVGALGLGTGPLIGVLAAVEAFNLIKASQIDKIRAAQDKIVENFERINELARENLIKDLNADLDDMKDVAGQAASEIERLANALEEKFNKALGEDTPKDLDKQIERVKEQIEGLLDAFGERQFGLIADRDGLEAFIDRITNLKGQGLAELNVGNLERARDLFGQMADAARELNDEIANNLNASLDRTTDILKAQDEFAFGRALEGKNNAEQINLTIARIEKLRAAAGQAGSIDEQREIFREIDQLIDGIIRKEDEFNQKLREFGGEPGTGRGLGLKERNFQDQLAAEEKFRQEQKNLIQDEIDILNQQVELEQQIEAVLQFQKKGIEDKNALLEKSREISEQILEINKSIVASEENRTKNLIEADTIFRRARTGIATADLDLAEQQLNIPANSNFEIKQNIGQLRAQIQLVNGLLAAGPEAADPEKIAEAAERIKELITELEGSELKFPKDPLSPGFIDGIFGSDFNLDSLDDLSANINDLSKALSALQEANEQEGEIAAAEAKVRELEAAYKAVVEAVGEVPEENGRATIETINQINAIVQELEKLETKIKNIPAINIPINNLGGTAPGFATGGIIGGPPGHDNQMINAHSGEFVVNSAATKRFYSQLVAINSGFTPKNFATGGPVSNFGDINVSVQGQPSSSQTAREIARHLQREIRRNTWKP